MSQSTNQTTNKETPQATNTPRRSRSRRQERRVDGASEAGFILYYQQIAEKATVQLLMTASAC